MPIIRWRMKVFYKPKSRLPFLGSHYNIFHFFNLKNFQTMTFSNQVPVNPTQQIPTPKVVKAKRNVYQEVTNAIIEKMKAGDLLWKQGFRHIQAQNWATKTIYSGINAVILNFLYGHEVCPHYATFKQIKSLGGMVKKGAKGKLVVYYSPLFKKDGKYIEQNAFAELSRNEKEGVVSFYTIKHYFVYNMLDTENCKGFDYDKWNSDSEPQKLEQEEMMLRFEEVLSHYKDKPILEKDRNKNCYIPTLDTIKFVPLKRWERASDFISTICHEIIHSTGHEQRLNRPNLVKPHAFGTTPYAHEELCAELGAAFLCQHIGIFPTQVENTAAYLQSWIQVLENDERLIFKAAAQAQKAVDYIFGESQATKNQ